MNSPTNLLYLNLKVIQCLPVNHKIYIRNDRLYTHDSAAWSSTLNRSFNGDSRIVSISFLHKMIESVKNSINDNDDSDHRRIIDNLTNTIPGLLNLKNTYYSDINTCAEIDTIIENIKYYIEKS